MKNIFVLPTDRPSFLFKDIKDNLMFNKDWFEIPIGRVNQNIYITSEEKPKKGEWCLHQIQHEYFLTKAYEDNALLHYKIILTTDPDLIKYGAIDDDFLQWFVKNSSCESVKVERLDTFKKTNEVYVDEIAGGNYYEIIKQYKIIIPQEETKQETLEKVAKKQWGNVHRTGVLGFIDGVKSDAARDYWFEKFKAEWYNEEEVRKLLIMQRGNSYVAILTKTKDEELARIASTAPEPGGKDGWVKQFKKK
jgi:hypothetical protein